MFDQAALAEMTADLVAAYVTKYHVSAAELRELISTVHASLVDMASTPEATPEPVKLVSPVSLRKSVTDEYLVSLEDGKRYQSLKRHLAGRGLSPSEYRAKWGLPNDYPMTSPVAARKRSDLAKSHGFGNLRKNG